jgi:hypothetical protein
MIDDKIDKQKFWDILIERGGNPPCYSCKGEEFTLLEDYMVERIWPTIKCTKASRKIVIVCDNCGHMNQHAIGILDELKQMPQDDVDDFDEKELF